MADLKITWAGAYDEIEIKGYELSWKVSTESNWTIEPFIETNESFGEYILTGATIDTFYNFRIRTQDTSDNWSKEYSYCNVNFPSSPIPTEPVISLEPTPNSIIVRWGGAFDVINIDGYDLEWKLSTDVDFNKGLFIETNSIYGSYELSGLTNLADYDIQMRSKNVSGNYSPYTPIQSATTISAYTYFASSDFLDDTAEDKCLLSYPSIQVYSNVERAKFLVGDILYLDASLTVPYKGDSYYWKVGNPDYGFTTYQIDTNGVILEYIDCADYLFEYNRSIDYLDYPTYTVEDACSNLSASTYTVYSNKDISQFEVGDYIYTDSKFTTTLFGQGKIWRVDDYGVLVANSGLILEIGSCPTLP